MIVADIKARRAHQLPHRTMQPGDTLARMQFASEEDFRFFANHLRWSAFAVDRVADSDPQPTPAAASPELAEAPSAPSPRPKARR